MKGSINHTPVKKIIIPRKSNTYLSFPTFTSHQGEIFIFYREGYINDSQIKGSHGTRGKIKCFRLDQELFINSFNIEDKTETLYDSGTESVLFSKGNEFDAIVSKLDNDKFTLATRTYIGKRMKTFFSFSDSPVFKERSEVQIKGTEWVVFYGKGFKWKEGYVFPAYGQLEGEDFERPFIVITDDFSRFDLLSYLPSDINGSIFNESSIVFDKDKYVIFMRDDTPPFGIWCSVSKDLQDWAPPELLFFSAHAPMAISHEGRVFLAYRDLVSLKKTDLSLLTFPSYKKITIDSYEGSPYDGGYADMAVIDGNIYALYYIGNKEGEPFIKCCRL